MDIDGLEVLEENEEYGYSWRWDDPRGIQAEILWDRQVGRLTLGTRMPPGGWTHNPLEVSVWGGARTIYEAREVVEKYISKAAAKPH